MSQIGVPYSWGGGNAAGPSHGIDSGAGHNGFDCSGLVLYSFAGVGIKLPHYSGSQYDLGRKIPSSQMRRGDVIFYGPGGSQHVTIYLGQRPDARGPRHRFEGSRRARAHQRHDALRDPLHRILTGSLCGTSDFATTWPASPLVAIGLMFALAARRPTPTTGSGIRRCRR